jgi:hypothetical protein
VAVHNCEGVPAKPVAIGGSPEVCAGTEQVYSIAEVDGADATGYVWEFPDGWEIISGDGTTSVTVTAGSSSGTNLIHVWATNQCGGGAAQTLAVTVNSVPDQPGDIAGLDAVYFNTSQTYSVASVEGVTYTWVVSGEGWSKSSEDNNTITVTAGSGNGTITVTPSNTCGSGAARTLAVAVIPAPAQPTKKDGAASVYQGHAYTCSVNEVAGVTYQWELPSGWTGATGTGSSISVTAGSATGNQTIMVTPINDCGNSGTPVLKPYLEDAFFPGLKTALGGKDYFYKVTRKITGGNFIVNATNNGFKTVAFSAYIFIDTMMEVFGENPYLHAATEQNLTQTALYAVGGKTWRVKKCKSTRNAAGWEPCLWWLASPTPAYTENEFLTVKDDGDDSGRFTSWVGGVVPAFCIQ